jgi:teichoic acid transport system ATP-binding protein
VAESSSEGTPAPRKAPAKRAAAGAPAAKKAAPRKTAAKKAAQPAAPVETVVLPESAPVETAPVETVPAPKAKPAAAGETAQLVDGELLTRAEVLERRAKRRAEAALNPPTVVVENLHVHYKVYGAGASRGSAVGALTRMVRRKNNTSITDVHAIKGISFVARRGESIGLIGSNGSGKSTLLRAIAGLLPAEKVGGVYTDGQPSLLGVNAALMRDLTGERNVVLGCLAMGLSPAEVKEKYQSIIDFSGIDENGTNATRRPMKTYSSGQGARLRFSIAAVKLHDVLLIDEALATGDAGFQRRSEDRIRDLRRNAGTVFVVSHSINSVRDICDRAIWLEKGVIRLDGDVDEVTTAYEEWSQRGGID